MSALAILGLLAAGVIVLGLVVFVVRMGEGGAEDARREARRLGLEVTDVSREVPVSRDRGKTWEIEPSRCARYSLPAPDGTTPSWALLQRPEEHHPPLPPGWRLEPDEETVPQPVRDALVEIAGGWDEELLELEADGEHVHAYWKEWGGTPAARRLEGYLDLVVTALEEAR